MPVNIETREVKLSTIKPNPHNPRSITNADMLKLIRSLEEFPEMKSIREIVVDEDMMILGGNMRWRAMRELKEKRAIVKIVKGLTPEQKKEFIIKDNGSFGVWDTDILANLWTNVPLVDWGVKIPDEWVNPAPPESSEAPRAEGSGPAAKEISAITALRPHPRNYRSYHEDQLGHIVEIIKQTRLYPDIIVASDNTILRGHSVVEAAQRMGIEQVPVTRIDIGPDEMTALKILTTDNEFIGLSSVDDRALVALLKEMLDRDPENGLLGTGYNAQMLAALIYVTRPSSEVADIEEAADWVGMPDFVEPENMLRVLVSCRTEADRAAFIEMIGIQPMRRVGKTWSLWYPAIERDDLMALRYDQERTDGENAAEVPDLRPVEEPV